MNEYIFLEHTPNIFPRWYHHYNDIASEPPPTKVKRREVKNKTKGGRYIQNRQLNLAIFTESHHYKTKEKT